MGEGSLLERWVSDIPVSQAKPGRTSLLRHPPKRKCQLGIWRQNITARLHQDTGAEANKCTFFKEVSDGGLLPKPQTILKVLSFEKNGMTHSYSQACTSAAENCVKNRIDLPTLQLVVRKAWFKPTTSWNKLMKTFFNRHPHKNSELHVFYIFSNNCCKLDVK